MAEKIKVLMSLNSLGMGGNVIFVMNFFRHIDKNKYHIDFLIYDDSRMDFYEEIRAAGSRVFVAKRNCKNKYLNLLAQMREVKKVLSKNHYDIIHCHSCSFVGIFKGAVPGFFTKGTRVISHAHSLGTPKHTLIDNFIRMCSKIFLSIIVDMGFSCSDYAGESKYTQKFMQGKRYAIIHNAVESEKYQFDFEKRKKIRNRINADDKKVIGNVGRLAKEKNQTFLIDIFAEIKKVDPQTMLLIIGGGELETMLKDKVKKQCLENDVFFTGSICDVEDYYSAMDVFVMPSLYEGLPFTAIEAQVNGLKCIISEVVTKMANVSGDTVFISLDTSPKKWGDVILAQAESRTVPEKVKKVQEEYDLKNEAKRLEQLYLNCITKNRR